MKEMLEKAIQEKQSVYVIFKTPTPDRQNYFKFKITKFDEVGVVLKSDFETVLVPWTNIHHISIAK